MVSRDKTGEDIIFGRVFPVKKIIIGSTAAQKYSLSRRAPSDLDIWCEEGIPKEKGLDVRIIQRQL